MEIRGFAVWRFEDSMVAEIPTAQDQFALLKQIGHLPEVACPAQAVHAGGVQRNVAGSARSTRRGRPGSRSGGSSMPGRPGGPDGDT